MNYSGKKQALPYQSMIYTIGHADYLLQDQFEPEHRTHLVKTVDSGCTWIHVQAIYVLVVNNLQNMTVSTYKHIWFFFLQPIAGPVVVARGIAADVCNPNLYAIQHKLLMQWVATAHGVVIDIPVNGNEGFTQSFKRIHTVVTADISGMPYHVYASSKVQDSFVHMTVRVRE